MALNFVMNKSTAYCASSARAKTLTRIMLLTMLLAFSGCSGDMDDLRTKVAEIRNRPGQGIKPLAPPEPYEAFVYGVTNMRSPFVPSAPAGNDLALSLRPDSKRSREFLEQFPLDTLKMVGTMEQQGHNYGLVKDKEGLVHKVLPGMYLGQNDGRITQISPTRISIIQIMPSGTGGYIESPAALTLAD